jgi:hypothetical protein
MLHFSQTGRLLKLAGLLLIGTVASATLQADSRQQYDAIFELQLEAGNDKAVGSLTIEQSSPLLPEIGLRMEEDRYRLISADGDTRIEDGRLYWELSAGRSELRYEVVLTQARGEGFDGLVTEDWAIFRGDDMFPTTKVDDAVSAESRSSLRLLLPKGWTAVAPYRGSAEDGWRVDKPGYRFDRPTGWILAGRIGVKRETIADVAITIAAPVGARAQRVSMLALLRWNLSWLVEQAPAVPSHLLIVAGPDPLWRGGLSAPNSLFIHADLALISEDGSSPLLHEVAHVLFPVDAADDEDWIDEGLAEYISLRALRESGTLSAQRYQRSIRHFRKRGERASSLYSADSKGDVTARAVAMLDDLDQELRAASDGQADMMELTRLMMASPEPLTMARIRELAAQLIGGGEARSLAPATVAWQASGPGGQAGPGQ